MSTKRQQDWAARRGIARCRWTRCGTRWLSSEVDDGVSACADRRPRPRGHLVRTWCVVGGGVASRFGLPRVASSFASRGSGVRLSSAPHRRPQILGPAAFPGSCRTRLDPHLTLELDGITRQLKHLASTEWHRVDGVVRLKQTRQCSTASGAAVVGSPVSPLEGQRVLASLAQCSACLSTRQRSWI